MNTNKSKNEKNFFFFFTPYLSLYWVFVALVLGSEVLNPYEGDGSRSQEVL